MDEEPEEDDEYDWYDDYDDSLSCGCCSCCGCSCPEEEEAELDLEENIEEEDLSLNKTIFNRSFEIQKEDDEPKTASKFIFDKEI